ncbi:MAG: hypothetical protein H6Q30_204 [Bacteroidetes bacterium]|nr:hypothetical protein [Bacteroidota bacterium]
MRHLGLSMLLLLCIPLIAISQINPGLLGTWEYLPHKSTDIDLYRSMGVELRTSGKSLVVVNLWGRGRSHRDSMTLSTDGTVVKVPVTNRVFPSNAFMGLMMVEGTDREVSASLGAGGKILKINEKARVRGSQGPMTMTIVRTYALADDEETMSYTIERSSRTTGPLTRFVLKREGSAKAYMMKLEDDWSIEGKLPQQAFLISLQGLANLKSPQLYFVYPEKWDFLYTPGVLEYYKEKRNYTFVELRSPEQALKTFRSAVKGYVVWDKGVRTSLIVAYTVAGLEEAVVVSEELIPMVEQAGLKPVADFRGKFTGKSDLEIFTWAYEQYWKRCSRDYVVWLGGEAGRIMKPGVADFGMYKKAFFSDLSCEVTDTAEYALARKILSEMKPLSMVMGWHSYAKDKERDYVTLTSNFGLRVEGLHTLPNMSFSCQTPASKGFVWKNNHSVQPGKRYVPQNKVYVALVQTDGMGLGAWFRPGRGAIPCSWEVTMNFLWLAPAMLEYFWTTATPNDYFVGGLSGPGYVYPKAIPAEKLPGIVAMTREQTRALDLPVFEFMDYSEGATVEGNTDLTKEVFETYVKGMPEATGFINGYAPAFTFAVRDGKPLVSFDYYLSPERPEADAAADLEELARVNPKRPYFLLIHIREYSDLQRTKNILDRVSKDFEVVPLDLFLRYAAEKPTFEERFRDTKWTKDARQFE